MPPTARKSGRSSVSAPVRGAPLVFGDRVFATSIDNKLHALAAVDGSDLWTFSGLSEVSGYVGGNSPAGSGDLIVAPFTSGELVGLRLESGRTVWNELLVGPRREARAFGNLADIRGRPVIDRGVVLAMGSAGTLAAIDLRSGQRLWERRSAATRRPGWPAASSSWSAARADVVCLERDTGKVKWVTPLTQYQDEKRRNPILWGGPVLAGDRLLVGGSTGELLALSPYTGEIIGKFDMRQPDAAGAGGGQPHDLRADRQWQAHCAPLTRASQPSKALRQGRHRRPSQCRQIDAVQPPGRQAPRHRRRHAGRDPRRARSAGPARRPRLHPARHRRLGDRAAARCSRRACAASPSAPSTAPTSCCS